MIERKLTDGGMIEYRDGRHLHRPNGPARIWENGSQAWWFYGDWHRYYGPHTSWGDNWYIHGKQVK